jgi:hypothetical protein
MMKRLLSGLVIGTLIGGVVAALLIQGIGMAVFSNGAVAYLAAAATGVITGLVAGKPIWSADGKIEAGLKALFGVLLGVGGMFALRTWANTLSLDLTMLKAGAGELGQLPAASLPLIAAVMAGFYEIDNSPKDASGKVAPSSSSSSSSSRGPAAQGKRVRIKQDSESGEPMEDEVAPVRKKGR